MKRLYQILFTIVAVSALVASAMPADAAAYLYAGKRKRIRCAVALVNSDRQPLEAMEDGGVGNLFYWLDLRTDMKPAGWTFENPLSIIPGGTDQAKADPDYWLVSLASARDLSDIDILYLPADGDFTLTTQDREKLRKFVDGGGVLWIDNSDELSPLDFQDSFFIQDLKFENAVGSYDIAVNRHHPLLTTPYWLTEDEINWMGYISSGGGSLGTQKCYVNPGYEAGNTWASFADPPTSFDILFPIVENVGENSPSVAANCYGSGRIIATANYVGRGCGNNYPYDLPSLKLAYNLMAWASSWTDYRKNPRHSGYSVDTVGGTRLIKLWSLPEPPTNGVESAPVIYKNIAFYTSEDTVYALDVFPSEDLDHDGNPDDGLQDDRTRADYRGEDLVWYWTGDGTLSSPTVITIQNPDDPGATIEAVLVSASDGMAYLLEAFPNDAGRLLDTTNVLLAHDFGMDAAGEPWPPLYVNGWIYIVGGNGCLYAFNPSLEAWVDENPMATPPLPAFEWTIPKSQGGQMPTATPKGGPNFGFVTNSSTGAVVGMVYWCTSNWSLSGDEPDQNDHVNGVPVYVSNDRLKIRSVSSDIATCDIAYKGAQISLFPEPEAFIKIGQDNPEPVDGTVEIDPTNPSRLRVEDSRITMDSMVYATYALDYGNELINVWPPMRRALEPRSSVSATSSPATISILGSPAVATENLMFACCQAVGGGGGEPGIVHGVFNDGNTQLTRWTYVMHADWDNPSSSGASSSVPVLPSVVIDEDGIPFEIEELDPVFSPAVAGEKVFAAVKGGALLCFKSDPDFVIRITESAGFGGAGQSKRQSKELINPATGKRMSVKIWQPNLLTDVPGSTVQPLQSAVSVPSEMIDYQNGTISFDTFDRIRMRGQGADIQQRYLLTPSFPVWIFLDNVEVPIDFSTWGPSVRLDPTILPEDNDAVDLSGWNNLLWYFVVPRDKATGIRPAIQSPPIVIGNTVYFVTDDGTLYALDTETGKSTGERVEDTIWVEEVVDAPGMFAPDTCASVAGSNGVLLVPGPDGLHAYANATTLIADASRVVEIDGAGDVTWSLDSIIYPASASAYPPERTSGVNKPSKVRYTDGGEILVVNSGANQVCKVSKSGRVEMGGFAGGKMIRWIYDAFADPKRLMTPGQPTRLNAPTDALFWEEYEPGDIRAYHCLIADSGNHRIVDLVYRFDGDVLINSTVNPATGFTLPDLNWVSTTGAKSRRYVYNSIELVPSMRDYQGTPVSCTDVWAAVSNYAPGTDILATPDATQGSGSNYADQSVGGAILALSYRQRPVDDLSSGWDYWFPETGNVIARCDRVQWPGGVKPIANPRSFQVTTELGAVGLERYILIADSHGVYKAGPLTGGANPPLVQIAPGGLQALTDADYRAMDRNAEGETPVSLGVPLVAVSAQELPNGRWLISNSYSGVEGPSPFKGEVFEYDPATRQILWNTPELGFEFDEFGVLMEWNQIVGNSYPIQQPRSARRQY